MNAKIVLSIVFPLIFLAMTVPAFAVVDRVDIDQKIFLIGDYFIISGTIDDKDPIQVFATISKPHSPSHILASTTSDDRGNFSFDPIRASEHFKAQGTYTINVFTQSQQANTGEIIELKYDTKKITTLADFDLVLNSIGNKQVVQTKTLTFTASVTDSDVKETYSLDKQPAGAVIDKNTGAFSWTPTSSQLGGFVFDIVVNVGPVEDRETILVTVNPKPTVSDPPVSDPPASTPPKIPPEPKQEKLGIASFVEKTKDPQSYVDRYNNEPDYKAWFDTNYPEYDSIYQAVGLETPEERKTTTGMKESSTLAVFVDPAEDPQSYIDRYNSDPAYKTWFDENFSEYESIYQAVGLETPVSLAVFVDPAEDPQSYIDRYNSDPAYKTWFDENFSEYDSIYEAVGLETPVSLAVFVDPAEDPQSYIDRYNSDPAYKTWFDENFSEYDSIYEAVGLETPVSLAVFVDPAEDPQSYIDRYNSDPAYKTWFDENFSEYDSIYEAVGLSDSTMAGGPINDTQKAMDETRGAGQCGEGTQLVDGKCVPAEKDDSGGCLIATAAYGSELAPQVQILREIRDNQLMDTSSGTSFMAGFNQLYYSFSPHIADMQRENPIFKEAVKVAITPLLSSLSIMSYAESESEVLGYGIGVILMNLGMYIAAPAIVILKARKYVRI